MDEEVTEQFISYLKYRKFIVDVSLISYLLVPS
jgi:hypothetical protein